MGAVCCVAARDKTVQQGSSGEILHRNFRHSPTWSFRWDNRVGAAGEESSVGGLSDVASRSDLLDLKCTTDVSAHVSDGGSSLENNQMEEALNKFPLNQESKENLIASASGHAISRTSSVKLKQYAESPEVSGPSSVKLSTSLSVSPRSSHSHQLLPSSLSFKLARGSPGRQSAELASGNRSLNRNSSSINSNAEDIHTPSGIPTTRNLSIGFSNARSSDGWSSCAFSQKMSASQREWRSFHSGSCNVSCDQFGGRNSGSVSVDFQTCGICSKLLTDKSAWNSQKIIAGNELSVIAVLVCGHVYHAECLEVITPEIYKYDPGCPICTFGQKQTLKMYGKMIKAEIDLKARLSRKLNYQVGDADECFDLDYGKSNNLHEGRIPKLSTSSSLKTSARKPFLTRHFSFGSRGSKPASDGPPVRKKGLFWAKSSSRE